MSIPMDSFTDRVYKRDGFINLCRIIKKNLPTVFPLHERFVILTEGNL